MFLLDIDYFKKINDHYGHGTVDQVLITLSRLVENNLRLCDTFARWGGEEFICLLPETNLGKTRVVAEKIRNLIANYDFGLEHSVTDSIGIAELESHAMNIDHLVDLADKALYKAKEQGRNRVCS